MSVAVANGNQVALDDYMTVSAAAKVLEVDPSEVFNLIHYHKKLHSTKIGVARLVLISDVQSEKDERDKKKAEAEAAQKEVNSH